MGSVSYTHLAQCVVPKCIYLDRLAVTRRSNPVTDTHIHPCYLVESASGMNEPLSLIHIWDAEGIDERENWNHHDIKIVSVDEAGSIDFVVYGYMNRGTHEGEVGTGVYHYDGLAHTIDEEAFIPSKTSYEVLKAEMGKMLYLNEKNEFYLMMDDSLYRINSVSYTHLDVYKRQGL